MKDLALLLAGALLFCAAIAIVLMLTSCVSVEATRDRAAGIETVRLLALGQVSVGVGCPAMASQNSSETSTMAQAGDGEAQAGGPCVSSSGGKLSDTLGNVLSGLVGLLAGILAVP